MVIAHERSSPERRAGATLALLRATGGLLLLQPRAWAWIPPVAWAAVIWASSARETVSTGGGPWRALAWNLAHVPVYALLALLLLPLAPRRDGWAVLGRRTVAALGGLALLYAVADEWHQSFVPGRVCAASDVLTDLASIATVILVARYVTRADASERGLRARLALAFLACAAAVAFATFENRLFASS